MFLEFSPRKPLLILEFIKREYIHMSTNEQATHKQSTGK